MLTFILGILTITIASNGEARVALNSLSYVKYPLRLLFPFYNFGMVYWITRWRA